LILLTVSPPALSGDPGGVLLAQNDQVLQAWQRSGGAAPELVRQEDGGTVIKWKGGAMLDAYHNSVSGGGLVTPYRSGNFHKLQVQGDLRAVQPNGDQTYLQFSATNTDDPAVLSHAPGTQINSLQFGHSADDYLFALGDVTADFSRLGSNTGLRGMLLQKRMGDDTLVSGMAGVLAESWEQLGEHVDRTRYIRHVYGAKLDTPFGEHSRVFVTAQSYRDDEGSLDAGLSVLAPSAAHTATAGFFYQLDRFALQGEAGLSRWKENDRGAENDHAFIVDATWDFDTLGLTAGHHDIGLYYSSLSTETGSGLRETYLNGNWLAADWLSINADVRHSENEMAAVSITGTPPSSPSVNSSETDSLATTANITFGPEYTGWSLMLNQSLSHGENSDGSSNRNTGYGSTLSYGDERWNASLGYQFVSNHNGGSSATDSDSRTWQFSLGRNWSNATEMASATWMFGLTLGLSRQKQELDTGGGPTTSSWQVGLNGQHFDWGTLSATYMRGTISGQPGSGDLRQKSWQIDASRPLGDNFSINFYLRNNTNSGSTTGADYEEDVVGIQLVWMN
jgi:hypothetical protein